MNIAPILRRLGAALLAVTAAPLGSQTPTPEALLDGVAARLRQTAAYKNWTASAVQTITELDRKGNPEKVTVVTKSIRVTDGRRSEDILKALVTEDGQTKDVTASYALEARKRREEDERRRAEEAGKRPDGRRSLRLDLNELLPFAADRRPGFIFGLREGADRTGRRLLLLDVKAKAKDPRNWDGTYTIDPATFDILRTEIRPSKFPKMVKELSLEAEVEILDGKYSVLKRTTFKVNGGFLFLKRVRMTVEDVYADVRVLDGAD